MPEQISLSDNPDGWAAQTAATLRAWLAAHPDEYPRDDWPRLHDWPLTWTGREHKAWIAILARIAEGSAEYQEFLADQPQ